MLSADPVATPGEPPHGGTLAAWLDWQTRLHSHRIELGLERVRQVAERLHVLPLQARSVIIAGTNGKGSCAWLIEALLRDRGHRVGSYTSPHLWRYNERVRIDGAEAGDAALCSAFEAVEAARANVNLTYFEFGTLAALWLFQRSKLDYAVLEVGMGGRLDAVNIVDADVALITNIGIDHAAFLGDTRAAIGHEKAGIMRTNRPVVCADRDMPQSIAAHADNIGAQLYRIGCSFDVDDRGWRGWAERTMHWAASLPDHVVPENLAAALAVTALLGALPRTEEAVSRACTAQRGLHGRREIVEDGGVSVIYDVGHNAQAIAVLVAWLRNHPVPGATHVVIGMLADKPVEAVAAMLAPVTGHFYAADLAAINNRGVDAATLARRVGHGAAPSDSPRAALAAARARARTGDRIVVCGSFYTVAHARREV